jgi:hypothetical protein
MLNQWLCSVFNNTFVNFINLYPLHHTILHYLIPLPTAATTRSRIFTWLSRPILNNCSTIWLIIDSLIQFLDFLEQFLYTPVLIVQLLLHLLQFTLLINAADDLVDVQLKAHVTHILIDIAVSNDLRGLDCTRWRDILEFGVWVVDKLYGGWWLGRVVSWGFNEVGSWDN